MRINEVKRLVGRLHAGLPAGSASLPSSQNSTKQPPAPTVFSSLVSLPPVSQRAYKSPAHFKE
jgi:hypothetical protein